MTHTQTALTAATTDPVHVIGPFSRWPRRPRKRARLAGLAALAGGAGIFVHCALPLIG